MKKYWRLQCLICKHSRKTTGHAIVYCEKVWHGAPIYYGSDMFTGFIGCDEFDPMQDPFKKETKKK